MTSVSQAVDIVARATGASVSKCRQIARRLLEDHHLPKSAGRYVATAGSMDITKLLLAVLSGAQVSDSSNAMRTLFDLRSPQGVTLGNTIYELLATVRALDVGADVAIDGVVEIDSETPRAVVRLNTSGEAVESIFYKDGTDFVAPLSETARRCTVMPTRALAKIAIALARSASKQTA